MQNRVSVAEITPELLLFRVQNGVKLIRPENLHLQHKLAHEYNTGHTIASLATLPFNFYFLNTHGETLHMNQQCVEICGFQSASDSLGKSLFDVSSAETAKKLIDNCNTVVAENKIKIFEEHNVRKDGVTLQFLSVKSPWYDESDQIKGIFGCSIVLGKQSLAESLLQITQLGLLNTKSYAVSEQIFPQIVQDKEVLSMRESLCILHLCKGFTMKETAKIIGLSPKTVETYIDRAKHKLKCKNKAELIANFLKQTQSTK